MEADIMHNLRDLQSKQSFIRNAFACFNYQFFSIFLRNWNTEDHSFS